MDTRGMFLFCFFRINVPTTSYSIRADMVTKLEKKGLNGTVMQFERRLSHLNSLRKRLSCRTEER